MPQNEPYVMMVNESDPTLTGNSRFEGFCVDLVNEIARLRNFSVEFDLVEGGSYGGIDPVTGKASGMVKALLEQVRDAYEGIDMERVCVLTSLGVFRAADPMS